MVTRIADWLTQKVDSLSLETYAAPKEAEDEVGGAGSPASGSSGGEQPLTGKGWCRGRLHHIAHRGKDPQTSELQLLLSCLLLYPVKLHCRPCC